jgi:hypothetical protein
MAATLTPRELAAELQISMRKFYRLKALGRFTHLETDVAHRYSREKTEAWLAGRSVHRVSLRVAS